ncbi:TB2/DP1 [Hexamita inflata]|uniref:TB2/DP1 n=1 Tax=Hexamita inflata TaxID=28002 RepID=A0ABP1I459_9EUKA
MFNESICQQMYSIFIPIYKSLKAAKSDQITDIQQWFAYWIIFAWVKFFEYSFNWVVQHIPYYQQVKPIFFAWLIRHNGALKLYNKVIAQTFIKVQLYVNDKQYRSQVNQNQLEIWKNNAQWTKNAFKLNTCQCIVKTNNIGIQQILKLRVKQPILILQRAFQ